MINQTGHVIGAADQLLRKKANARSMWLDRKPVDCIDVWMLDNPIFLIMFFLTNLKLMGSVKLWKKMMMILMVEC